jgi:hypothetical protein
MGRNKKGKRSKRGYVKAITRRMYEELKLIEKGVL